MGSGTMEKGKREGWGDGADRSRIGVMRLGIPLVWRWGGAEGSLDLQGIVIASIAVFFPDSDGAWVSSFVS